MRGRAFFLRAVLVSAVFLIQSGCDRAPQSNPQQKEPAWAVETMELPLDSLIDSAVARDKQGVEEAHKRGDSKVVGGRDGKWWMEASPMARISYVNALGDVVGALNYINNATSSETERQKRIKNLEYEFAGGSSFHGPVEAESMFSGRIQEVTGGRSFGDLVDAITKFYQNKPLLKDKPVLWVMAGPLYKELQEAKPQEKKASNDMVRVRMRKKAE